MPTGYTADVSDGKLTDFRTFALRCSRNFGACIMQRDEATESLPRLRELDDYYVRRVEETRKRLGELAQLTPEGADRAAQVDYQEAFQSYQEREQRRTETRNRYNAMLADVLAWKPPTKDHEGLKKFMIDQLTESRKFDCDFVEKPPIQKTGDEWLAMEKERAQRAADDAAVRLGEERERIAGANRWISKLYESLPAGESGATGRAVLEAGK